MHTEKWKNVTLERFHSFIQIETEPYNYTVEVEHLKTRGKWFQRVTKGSKLPSQASPVSTVKKNG